MGIGPAEFIGRGDWADKAADLLIAGEGGTVDVLAEPARDADPHTGAYRDTEDGKPDYIGILSPLVIRAFGEYMVRHRRQSDGRYRGDSNWKRGQDKAHYLRSLSRHYQDLMLEIDGYDSRDGIDEALGGLMFNLQGFWLELLKARRANDR
jgi:hypothetical protein